MLQPRFRARSVVDLKLVLNGVGDKLTKRNSLLGRSGLGAAKKSVRDLQRGLHPDILPYLWEAVNRLPDKGGQGVSGDILQALFQGMTVQAIHGASRDELLRLSDMALRTWPR